MKQLCLRFPGHKPMVAAISLATEQYVFVKAGKEMTKLRQVDPLNGRREE